MAKVTTSEKYAALAHLPSSSEPSLYIAICGPEIKIGHTTRPLYRAKALAADIKRLYGYEFGGMCLFEACGGAAEEADLLAEMRAKFALARGAEYFMCTFADAHPVVEAFCKNSRPIVAARLIREIEKQEAFAVRTLNELLDRKTALKKSLPKPKPKEPT